MVSLTHSNDWVTQSRIVSEKSADPTDQLGHSAFSMSRAAESRTLSDRSTGRTNPFFHHTHFPGCHIATSRHCRDHHRIGRFEDCRIANEWKSGNASRRPGRLPAGRAGSLAGSLAASAGARAHRAFRWAAVSRLSAPVPAHGRGMPATWTGFIFLTPLSGADQTPFDVECQRRRKHRVTPQED
jgi:hypothetical protein